MDLEEDIPQNHPVRLVNEVVNGLSDSLFDALHPGGGRPSYPPKMLTKILLYAYTQRIYSSRQMAKAVRENIMFMWLAGRLRPDFRTLNRFRSERVQGLLETVFASVLELLVQEGHVSLDHYFVDGTKIEANANRYTFVWKKAVVHRQAKLQEKVRILFASMADMQQEEDTTYAEADLPECEESHELTPAKVEQMTQQLEKRLLKQPQDKPVKKAVRLLRRDLLPRLGKYEAQLEQCGDRNSFSKTDPDATFLRMKEDHMRNGQLKPGYNVQIGTENQFILGYSVHQRAGDSKCLTPHLEHWQKKWGRFPRTLIADAGYGSEENYSDLEEKQIQAFVKYSHYHKEKSRAWKTDIRKLDNWTYDEEEDRWTCPNGRLLTFAFERMTKTERDYEIRTRHYRSTNCEACPLREACTKAEGNREIAVSLTYHKQKQAMRERLRSEEGYALSVRRMIEPESVFGQLKNNREFRRFRLRGLEKVSLEVGWLCLAHNLLKQAAKRKQNETG